MAEADLVILNTCHIREKAAEKVYSELGRLRRAEAASARRRAATMTIAVAGCVAQAEGAEILRARAGGRPGGRAAGLSPPAGAARARGRGRAASSTPNSRPRTSSTTCPAGAPRPARGCRAFLTCRKAATSSAPSASCPIRAAPRSRGRSAQIVAEAERLADAGVREITLLGQNVNAYHGDGPDGRRWGARRACSRASPRSPGSRASATPPAIRATWTTT